MTYNKEDDTFILSSDYFASLLQKLRDATKETGSEPDATVAAMDAAYLSRFPHAGRLTARAGMPLAPSRPKHMERTSAERAEYEQRFPNARRLSSGV